jgi:hypothetical protein
LRREDLQQRLTSLQLSARAESPIGQNVKEIRVFEALDTGYEVSEGKVIAEGVAVDGGNSVGSLVAIEVSTGDVFDLWGFKNSGLNFNRLIEYLGTKVEDRLDALVVLDDYLVFANGLREPSDEIVVHDTELRIEALRYF